MARRGRGLGGRGCRSPVKVLLRRCSRLLLDTITINGLLLTVGDWRPNPELRRQASDSHLRAAAASPSSGKLGRAVCLTPRRPRTTPGRRSRQLGRLPCCRKCRCPRARSNVLAPAPPAQHGCAVWDTSSKSPQLSRARLRDSPNLRMPSSACVACAPCIPQRHASSHDSQVVVVLRLPLHFGPTRRTHGCATADDGVQHGGRRGRRPCMATSRTWRLTAGCPGPYSLMRSPQHMCRAATTMPGAGSSVLVRYAANGNDASSGRHVLPDMNRPALLTHGAVHARADWWAGVSGTVASAE